jgi:two-component system cell cycle response regulator DivK
MRSASTRATPRCWNNSPPSREGLAAGERVIVMATEPHLHSLRAEVADFARVTALDAAALADEIAPGGRFDREACERLMRGLVGSSTGPCRMFGEMVSLLAERGHFDAALAIEAVGEALKDNGVTILCAYHLNAIKAQTEARASLAALHDRVDGDAPPLSGSDPSIILIADDFEDARELYAEYLRFSGLRVVTAASGEEALTEAREHRPALVLMDVRMPGMTGTDAMRILRQDSQFAQTPIIALTAHALESERAAILADGFDGVISKPCLPDELLRIVRARLREAPARA